MCNLGIIKAATRHYNLRVMVLVNMHKDSQPIKCYKCRHLFIGRVMFVYKLWDSNHPIRRQLDWGYNYYHRIIEMKKGLCILIWTTCFNVLRKMQRCWPQVKSGHTNLQRRCNQDSSRHCHLPCINVKLASMFQEARKWYRQEVDDFATFETILKGRKWNIITC